jgi:hypothetical protein
MKLLSLRLGPLAVTQWRQRLAKKINPDIQRLQSKLTRGLGPRRMRGSPYDPRGVLCGRLGARFITEAANGAACVSAKLCKKGKRQAQLGPFNEFHAFPNFYRARAQRIS